MGRWCHFRLNDQGRLYWKGTIGAEAWMKWGRKPDEYLEKKHPGPGTKGEGTNTGRACCFWRTLRCKRGWAEWKTSREVRNEGTEVTAVKTGYLPKGNRKPLEEFQSRGNMSYSNHSFKLWFWRNPLASALEVFVFCLFS